MQPRIHPSTPGPRRRLVAAASALLGGAMLLLSGQATPLAVRAGTVGAVDAWGGNLYYQLGLDTGLAHAPFPLSALHQDEMSPVPLPFSGQTGMVGVEAGSGHSLALKSDGTVWAWGRDYEGQLGDGSSGGGPKATAVEVHTDATHALTGITAIAAGGYHSLALDVNRNVWSWGSNSNGQLGNGTTTASPYAIRVQLDSTPTYLSNVTAIAASFDDSLAISSGNVYGWGWNQFNQLGDNTTTDRWFPVRTQDSTTPTYLSNVTDIAAGYFHSVAVKNDGTAWGWGNASQGQVGDGTFGDTSGSPPCNCRAIATQVRQGAGSFTTGTTSALAWPLHRVRAGAGHSVVLKSDGTVWGWGDDSRGQLGDGNTGEAIVPSSDPCLCRNSAVEVQIVQVAGTALVPLSGIQSVGAGSNHSLALSSHGTGFAWGLDSTGQLGDGTVGDVTPPASSIVGLNPQVGCFCRQSAVPILGLAGASAIAGGGANSMAVVG